MADVTLAEYNDNVWLVGGEPHIDDLLANTLPAHITIEVLTCETKSQVHDLWVQLCGEPPFPGDPWLIHPAIVNRIRRADSGYAIYFGQWSAQLDTQAESLIVAAARHAHGGTGKVTLTEFIDEGSPPFAADLARVRLGMIEQILLREGVAQSRLEHARRDLAAAQAVGQDAQRVDILIEPMPAAAP